MIKFNWQKKQLKVLFDVGDVQKMARKLKTLLKAGDVALFNKNVNFSCAIFICSFSSLLLFANEAMSRLF